MVRIKKIKEAGQTIYPATITQAIRDGESGKPMMDMYAQNDKRYPKMSVGFAENIVGDGSASEEEFSFRPTAGANRNIKNDGAARIEKIKGNSVAWSMPINNIVGASPEAAWVSRTGVENATSSNGVITWAITDDGSARNMLYQNIPDVKNGDWIYFRFGYKSHTMDAYGKPINVFFGSGVGQRDTFPFLLSNQLEGHIEGVFQLTTEYTDINSIIIKSIDYNNSIGKTIEIRNFTFINLTNSWGSGNEPTTVEEFYQRIPIGVDINAYNEGEIINSTATRIKTTGFNQFNGTYAKVCAGVPYYFGGTYTSLGFTTEEGSTAEEISLVDNKYTPSSNGYIYAEGTDICINLSWDEYEHMNGMYAPYKPFTRDLSFIKSYFPDGMRSAGTVRDEIRFNSTTQKWEAVQNVGVRAFAEGDDTDTTVTTDGTNTNYALTSPIVTEIAEEDFNLDYDTSDYGTEALLSDSPSAPIVADIVYEPNALATLKNVPDILTRLTALERQMQSLTTTTSDEVVE